MDDEFINTFFTIYRRAEVYVVGPGDTFDKVVKNHPTAIKEKVMVKEMISANPGVDPTRLQIGQKIIIPTGAVLQEIRLRDEAPRASAGEDLAKQIDQAFSDAAAAHGVSEPILRGIAATESGGDVCAVSGAGAQGLMQLMPKVQRMYGVTDPFDPISSVWGAAAHLSYVSKEAAELLKYIPQADVEKAALTMYNMGETAYRTSVRTGKKLPKEAAEYADKVRSSAGTKLIYRCSRNIV